jgi:hypothetical protein
MDFPARLPLEAWLGVGAQPGGGVVGVVAWVTGWCTGSRGRTGLDYRTLLLPAELEVVLGITASHLDKLAAPGVVVAAALARKHPSCFHHRRALSARTTCALGLPASGTAQL